jgi:hypothetical protein
VRHEVVVSEPAGPRELPAAPAERAEEDLVSTGARSSGENPSNRVE